MTATPDPKLIEAGRTACDDDTPWPQRCAFPKCNCRFAVGFLAGRAHGLEQAAQLALSFAERWPSRSKIIQSCEIDVGNNLARKIRALNTSPAIPEGWR
ncbi:MAG TPA: hypothetical protein VH020_09360 [Stellaceae bacterium]|nr:hypothetical protein [Stellaceae bacterium]